MYAVYCSMWHKVFWGWKTSLRGAWEQVFTSRLFYEEKTWDLCKLFFYTSLAKPSSSHDQKSFGTKGSNPTQSILVNFYCSFASHKTFLKNQYSPSPLQDAENSTSSFQDYSLRLNIAITIIIIFLQQEAQLAPNINN